MERYSKEIKSYTKFENGEKIIITEYYSETEDKNYRVVKS